MHDKNTWDYRLSVNVNLNYNGLYSQLTGSGGGSTQIDDWGDATMAAGKVVHTSETVQFIQKGNTTATVTSGATLKDAAGHTQTWTLVASASGSVNDSVVICLNNGTEYYRVFHINESSGNKVTYDEGDNGYGLPPSTATSTYVGSHSLHTTSAASSSTVEDGTPNNYTFTLSQSNGQSRQENRSSAWENLATGDGGSGRSANFSASGGKRTVSGTRVNGLPEQSTKLMTTSFATNSSSSDSESSSPTSLTDGHSWSKNSFTLWKNGTIAAGTGKQTTSGSSAMWGTATSNGKPTPWGNEKGTAFGPEVVDLSWPSQSGVGGVASTLWSDFQSSSIPAALQIGAGELVVFEGLALIVGTGGCAVVPVRC